MYIPIYIQLLLMTDTVSPSRGSPETVKQGGRGTVEQGSANSCFVMLGTAFLTSDFK